MTPDPNESRAAARARLSDYHFGVVLLLLFVTFVFMASGPTGAWVRVVTVTLQGATLLAVLVASQAKRRLLRLAAIIVLVGLASSLVSLFFNTTENGNGVFFGLNALLVGACPVVIVQSMRRRRVVDIHTVLAAVCIYILIGMLAAYVFSAVGNLGSGAFFAQEKQATTADYLYFSFATISTVGYGDLTAAGGLGRALAVLEAVIGQLYLVTVVALLVSNLSRPRNTSAS